MVFNFNFYSSLLLIFFVHAIVYAILCWRKAKTDDIRSMQWLGLLLLLGAGYIMAWMVGFAGWYDEQPYRNFLFYAPTNTAWLLGPVMFIYIQSFLNPGYRFRGKQWLHFLPYAIYLLAHIIIFILDKVVKISPPVLVEEVDPDYTEFVKFPGLIINMIYAVAAIRYYMLYRRLMLQVVSYAEWVRFKWIRNFLFAFLLFIAITTVFVVIGFFTKVYYKGSWWYYLSFALIFYSIAINGYSNRIAPAIAFQPKFIQNRPAIYLGYSSGNNDNDNLAFVDISEEAKTSNLVLSEDDRKIKDKLLAKMAEEKLYEDQELNLLSLAKYMGTNPSVLSRVINRGCSLNFNDFVNEYRVSAIQKLFLDNRHKKETLLSLAYEVGFNSKATFNRAFQKITGCSPVEWIAENVRD